MAGGLFFSDFPVDSQIQCSQLQTVSVLDDDNKRWDFISPLSHLPGKQV